jgi:hypothetical protein
MIRGSKKTKNYIDSIKIAELRKEESERLRSLYNDKLIRILREYITREVDQDDVLKNLKDLGTEVKNA